MKTLPLSLIKSFRMVRHAFTLSGQVLTKILTDYVSLILHLQVQAGLKINFTRNPRRYVLVRTLAYPLVAYLMSYTLIHVLLQHTLPPLQCLGSAGPSTLNYLPLLASILAIPIYAAMTYFKATERGRKIERELKYFIVSESIVASGDPDIIDDLSSLNEDIFPTLSKESKVFSRLRKLMTAPSVVSTYCRWVRSRFVNLLLKDYIFASSLGMKIAWLREKGNEILEDLRVSSLNIVKARTIVSVLLAVILGYVPPIVVTLAALLGQSLISRALILMLATFPMFFLVIPKLPTHFRMFLGRGLLPLRITLLIACLAALLIQSILVCLPPYLHGVFYSLWRFRVVFCIALLVASLQQVRDLILALNEAIGLSSALLSLANAPLGVSNALTLLREVFSRSGCRSLRILSKEFGLGKGSLRQAVAGVKLWLTKYVIFTLGRALTYGVFNRESIMRLRELTTEMMRQLKMAATNNLALVALCVCLPYILTYTCSFNPHASGSLILNMYVTLSTFLYSVYVSYVVFDDPLNTLLPAAVMLELSLARGINALLILR